MAELGLPVTALGVAEHYAARYPGLVDTFVLDESDATLAPQVKELGFDAQVLPTVMRSDADKATLARRVLQPLMALPD